MLVVAWLVSCTPRQAKVQDVEPTARLGKAVTAEDVIRENDLERLWSLEEYAAEQHQLDKEIALLDGDAAGDADYAADGEEERPGGKMEDFGRATWSVLVVAFTLGMAALPFLV
jgi:hypothetical protein